MIFELSTRAASISDSNQGSENDLRVLLLAFALTLCRMNSLHIALLRKVTSAAPKLGAAQSEFPASQDKTCRCFALIEVPGVRRLRSTTGPVQSCKLLQNPRTAVQTAARRSPSDPTPQRHPVVQSVQQTQS